MRTQTPGLIPHCLAVRMHLALFFCALVLGWSVSVADPEPQSYVEGRKQFVRQMVGEHGFDADALQALLGQARYRQEIIDAMERPYEGKPWHRYRGLFLTEDRIAGGVAFWRENAPLLRRAQMTYGVPPEIIVAILGVETNYGARMGEHRALDALTTLGFSYPKRADFFRGELGALLLLSREELVQPLDAVGSYAGALGKPQFIPTSYRAYAVDFDGDGKRDLWGSNADVIGSVANYFQHHGWLRDEPVAVPARLERSLPEHIDVAEKRPIAPNTTAGHLRVAGVDWRVPLESDLPVTLIRLDGQPEEYWVGLANFYVITRYNHSNLYAMAVYQLSGAIRDQVESVTEGS